MMTRDHSPRCAIRVMLNFAGTNVMKPMSIRFLASHGSKMPNEVKSLNQTLERKDHRTGLL